MAIFALYVDICFNSFFFPAWERLQSVFCSVNTENDDHTNANHDTADSKETVSPFAQQWRCGLLPLGNCKAHKTAVLYSQEANENTVVPGLIWQLATQLID